MRTQEELVERGRRASLLLNDPTVREAFDELSTMHLQGLVAAPPGDKGREARDYHHMLHYALSELGMTLKGYADTGAQIEAMLDMKEDSYAD